MARPRKTRPEVGWADRAWVPGLIVLFAVAVALRLAAFVQGQALPHVTTPVLDSRYYLEVAHAIAHAGGLGAKPFFMNPGYVLLVAAFDGVFDSPRAPVVLFQIALDGVTCVLTAVLTRRIFGAAAGLVAGVLVALNGSGIVAATSILPETVAAFGMTVSGLLLTRGPNSLSNRNLLALGAVLGVLALLRSNAVLIFPFLIVALRLHDLRSGWRVWAGRSLLVLAGGAAVVAPITLRNAVAGKDFVLVSSSGGINFYLGNSVESDGRFLSLKRLALAPGRLQDDPSGGHLERTITAFAEERSGRPLKPSEVSSFWTRLALSEMAADPGRWLRLLGRKTFLYFNSFELPQIENLYFLAGHLSVLQGPAASVSRLLWPLAMFGILAFLVRSRGDALRGETGGGLLLWILAGYVLSVVLFFVTARHRLPSVPLLACFAGGGAALLFELFRGGKAGRLAYSLLLLGCLLLSNSNPALGQPQDGEAARHWFLPDRGYYDFAMQHSNTSALLLEQGDWASAETECREGLRESPRHPSLLFNLGRALEQKGDLSGAEEAMRQSLEVVPDNGGVAAHYGQLAYKRGDLQNARRALERAVLLSPTLASAWNSLGPLRFQQGDAEGAMTALLEAERLSPGWHVPAVNRAIVLIRLGRFEEAVTALAALRKRQPAIREVTLALAEALLGAGRLAEGEVLLQEHLSRSPSDVDAWLLRVQLQLAKGEVESATAALRRILSAAPGDRRAQQMLRRLDAKAEDDTP